MDFIFYYKKTIFLTWYFYLLCDKFHKRCVNYSNMTVVISIYKTVESAFM